MNEKRGIEVPQSDGCAFCDYLEGVRPFTILARGRYAALLVTREPRGIDHLLAIPTAHTTTLLDLEEPGLSAVMHATREAARAITATESVDAISVWQNNGVGANQKVGHMHFHIAGTSSGSETQWGEVPEIDISETDRTASRLRAAYPLNLM